MNRICKECGIIVDEANFKLHENSHYELNKFYLLNEVKRVIDWDYECLEDYKAAIKSLREEYFRFKDYGFQGWEK